MINLRNCEFGFKCNANWDEMIVSENEHIQKDNGVRHDNDWLTPDIEYLRLGLKHA
jgi:hypothetical protein